jgi:cell division protein FtsB
MSAVRVNLLPPEVAQRRRQRRITGIVAALLALYVALLGGLYAVKLRQVADTRQARDAEQAEVDRLADQLVALQEFRVLERELQQRDALLSAAMAEEVGVARLLNELALVVPPTASLRTLTLTLEPPPDAVAQAAPPPSASPTPSASPSPPVATPSAVPAPGRSPAEPQPIGGIAYEGYTVEGYAPGVMALLTGVAQIPAVTDPFATSAQVEAIGDTEVTTFSGTAEVDDRAYTRRYAEGLPAGVVE